MPVYPEYDPYEGTVVAPDGKRYDPEDPDFPTEAPDRVGKFLTSGGLDAAIGNAIPDEPTIDVVTVSATGGTCASVSLGEDSVASKVIKTTTTLAQFKTIVTALGVAAGFTTDDYNATGSTGGPFTLTWVGQFLGKVAPVFDIDDTGATGGTVTVERTSGRSEEGLAGLKSVLDDHEGRLDVLES